MGILNVRTIPADFNAFTELAPVSFDSSPFHAPDVLLEPAGDQPGTELDGVKGQVATLSTIGCISAGAESEQIHQLHGSQPEILRITNTDGIIVTSPAHAELIKGLSGTMPVIAADTLAGMLKEAELHDQFGIEFKDADKLGMYHLQALLLDRLLFSRTRPVLSQWNQINETPAAVAQGIPVSHLRVVSTEAGSSVVYVQQPEIFSGTTTELTEGPVQLLDKCGVSLSRNVVTSRNLMDHVPLATGEHTQPLVTLIAALEIANATGCSIGKVTQPLPAKLDRGQVNGFYAALESAFGLNGPRLIDAGPEHFKALNLALRAGEGLGQLLPSVYALLRGGFVDLDRVHAVGKSLHMAHFGGFPAAVTEFLPPHLRDRQASDDPAVIAAQLDEEVQRTNTKPATGGAAEFHDNVAGQESVDADGLRVRQGDVQSSNEVRDALDKAYQPFYLFNDGRTTLEDAPELAALAARTLQELDVVTITPAYVEPDAWDVARAAAKLTPGRVILASPDPATLKAAAAHAYAVDQNQVMDCIRFDRLREMGLIPADREVKTSGKGTTILAGALWAMGQGLLQPGQYMAHCDTDIANMDAESLCYKNGMRPTDRLPYRPLEYMGAALGLMPVTHRPMAIQPAKVGPGRKNLAKHPVFDQLANDRDFAMLRRLGLGLGRVVWASPGEAIVNSSLYLGSPWEITTGFDLVRYYNAVVMENFLDGKPNAGQVRDRIFAQVNVPPDKIEDAVVSERNDLLEVIWATSVIMNLAQFTRDAALVDSIAQRLAGALGGAELAGLPGELTEPLSPAFPPDFTPDHLRAFNARVAGVERREISGSEPDNERLTRGGLVITAQQMYEAAGGPNMPKYRQSPCMLPSPLWMIEHDLIDMDAIAKIDPVTA